MAGSAAAWELARRGRSVVLLDRFEQGHERGSSHGGERIVRLAYTSPEYVELGLEAIRGWRELEAQQGIELLHATGAIDHGFDDELDEVEAAYRRCGVRSAWLTAAEAMERWPGLRFDGRVLLQPDGGWVQADLALRTFVAAAAGLGAEVRFGEPVLGIEDTADAVHVHAAGASWKAAAVVVAAGAWAPGLVPGGVDLPALRVTQEQVAYFEPRPGLDWPCFIHRSAPLLYGLPTPDGRVKVGEHQTGPVVDPDRRTFDLEPVAWQRLVDSVPAWVPGLAPEPVRGLTCLYATTATDDFVLDRVGRVVA